MKLLLFSDIHCNEAKCKLLIEKSTKADIVIGAGDFGSFRRGIKSTINLLREIKKPAIVVPGNSESYDELEDACRVWPDAVVLHGNGVSINGLDFFGIGGGIPVTPFGSWSYDFSEDEARQLLVSCPKHGILVTHSPPRGVLDISSSGKNLGSVAIREVVLTKKPILVVCGHIHESSGEYDKLDESWVVNAGPNGMYWDLV